MSHRPRAALASRYPVHVTLQVREGLASLLGTAEREALLEAFAKGCERDGFRMVQFSVRRDRVHLVAEGRDRSAFARGVQGLTIRMARALNRLWGRKGKLFGDRYDERILRTPAEVRDLLRYLLGNGTHPGMEAAGTADGMSSAAWFDGWREKLVVGGLDGVARPVAEARTWLMRVGWRRHGLLALDEASGPPGRMPPTQAS